LCRAAGKTGKAIQAYSTAHELNRDDIKPLRELSEMFFESEETEIPVKTVEQYIALQTSRSNFGEAALTCERLIERFPEHEEYKEKLKDIQSCLSGSTEKGTAASSSTPEAEDHDAGEEDLEETIEALKYVAARSKTNTEAREKLAAMYKQSGNIQEEIRVLDGLAALYKKSGNAAQARKTAERSSRLRKKAGISSTETRKSARDKKQSEPGGKTRASRKSGDDEPLFKDIPMSIDDFEKGFKG
jgi:DNA-binding SARP family transcriptional activator